MDFSIVCNKCDEKATITNKGIHYKGMQTKENIDIEIVEKCDNLGCMIDYIEITCDTCGNILKTSRF